MTEEPVEAEPSAGPESAAEGPADAGGDGVAGRPVIFGEVLFDVFPDGDSVLGGAPFNVAWHLAGFGLDPLFVSRVGSDGRGRRVREAMETWGMDPSGLQEDRRRPTGQVRVELEGGQPTYTLMPEQAYDHIDADGALRAVERGTEGSGRVGSGPALVCHGTLIQRSEDSRRALERLFRATAAPGLVDLNLRRPWWDRKMAVAALERARWAKLNEEELGEVSGEADEVEEPDEADDAGLPERARRARQRFGLEMLLVTRGSEGALLVLPEDRGSGGEEEGEEAAGEMAGPDRDAVAGRLLRRAPRPLGGERVDTVGAGDAFTAVLIAGLLAGWPGGELLERGLAFASEICRRRGATHREPELYGELRQRWGLARRPSRPIVDARTRLNG